MAIHCNAFSKSRNGKKYSHITYNNSFLADRSAFFGILEIYSFFSRPSFYLECMYKPYVIFMYFLSPHVEQFLLLLILAYFVMRFVYLTSFFRASITINFNELLSQLLCLTCIAIYKNEWLLLVPDIATR